MSPEVILAIIGLLTAVFTGLLAFISKQADALITSHEDTIEQFTQTIVVLEKHIKELEENIDSLQKTVKTLTDRNNELVEMVNYFTQNQHRGY